MYRLKLKLKPLFHSLLQLSCILFFGWYHNRLFEMAIIYCCFFIFRATYEKQYHAKTTWLCTIYTIIVFYIVSAIAPSKETSLLMIVILTYFINFVSFHLREYLDLRAKIMSNNKIKIKKGICKEHLLEICKNVNTLSELQVNILIMFYCDRKKIQYIAFKIGYSYDRIWQLKDEALKEIDKFYKTKN